MIGNTDNYINMVYERYFNLLLKCKIELILFIFPSNSIIFFSIE